MKDDKQYIKEVYKKYENKIKERIQKNYFQ